MKCLLADDSQEMSSLIYPENACDANLSSTEVRTNFKGLNITILISSENILKQFTCRPKIWLKISLLKILALTTDRF